MDALTLFGLVAVTAMLTFYALEDHSPWFILAFAGACGLASAYGFLQGAWPFGIIEAIWAGVAVRRWRIRTCVYEYTPWVARPLSITRTRIWRKILEFIRLPLPLLPVGRGRFFDRNIWPDFRVFRVQ